MRLALPVLLPGLFCQRVEDHYNFSVNFKDIDKSCKIKFFIQPCWIGRYYNTTDILTWFNLAPLLLCGK